MKTVHIAVFAVVLGLLQALSRAEAQSLADIARQEKQRRSLMIDHAPVITNDDLARGEILSPELKAKIAAARLQQHVITLAASQSHPAIEEVAPETIVVLTGLIALPVMPAVAPELPSLAAPLNVDTATQQEQELSLGQLARQFRARHRDNPTTVANSAVPSREAPAKVEVSAPAVANIELKALTPVPVVAHTVAKAAIKKSVQTVTPPVVNFEAKIADLQLTSSASKAEYVPAALENLPDSLKATKSAPAVIVEAPAAPEVLTLKKADSSTLKDVAEIKAPAIKIKGSSSRSIQSVFDLSASVEDASSKNIAVRDIPIAEHQTASIKTTVRVAVPSIQQTIETKKTAASSKTNADLVASATQSSGSVKTMQNTQKSAAESLDSNQPFVIRVRKGESLWQLAKRYLGSGLNWSAIWRANAQIQNPSQIRIGQSLTIPAGDGAERASNVIPIAKGRNKAKRT